MGEVFKMKKGRPLSKRKCKIKGCNRKHKAKCYCYRHYQRKFVSRIPLNRKIKCGYCKKIIPDFYGRLYCNKTCRDKFRYYFKGKRERHLRYLKENYVYITVMGKAIRVYTDGVTEEVRPMIPAIKNKVYDDCIKNPKKYLR